ncbi:ERF family protein [Acinetobacter bereziniae]|uniref:ERF family protein n=1 Tax=Acinetobacter bereziniae TaxID=106648 RepID=UPI0021CDADD4|nr:ERF family protein [Acinetobacter bereziniae]MCU4320625.1 ERF family protein [Acinetobacter bereziniae]
MQNNKTIPDIPDNFLLNVSYKAVDSHKSDTSNGLAVHKAILLIQQEIIDAGGIKKRFNEIQRYFYHSIDDLYAIITPLMLKHQLTCIAHTENSNISQFFNNKMELQFKATAQVRFIITSVEDGSSIETVIHGEANDNGDKALSKVLSIAKKNLYMQLFAIPLNNQEDEKKEAKNKPWGNDQSYYNNNQSGYKKQNKPANQAQQQNLKTANNSKALASLELKNVIDERLRPYNTRLNVVLQEAGLDMATVTDAQLRQLYNEVKAKLRPKH